MQNDNFVSQKCIGYRYVLLLVPVVYAASGASLVASLSYSCQCFLESIPYWLEEEATFNTMHSA